MSFDPHHGGIGFSCKSGTSDRWGGHWGLRFYEFFEGTSSEQMQGLPKHRPVREIWLAPVDAEGLNIQTGVPPYGYGTNEYWRARERNYVDHYPRTFTKIGPVVRWQGYRI